MNSDDLIDIPGNKLNMPNKLEIKRWFFIMIGFGLFLLVFYSPRWPGAVAPSGKYFALSREGKGVLAVFFLAVT